MATKIRRQYLKVGIVVQKGACHYSFYAQFIAYGALCYLGAHIIEKLSHRIAIPLIYNLR